MRIVLKVGTRVLTDTQQQALDTESIANLSALLAALSQRNYQVVLVTSGAIGAGLFNLGQKQRPEQTAALQALAALGQCQLMQAYSHACQQHALQIAQLLLSYSDLESPESRRRVLGTLEALWALENVIPIVNENDSVAIEELKYGDNDVLSARLAAAIGAQRLFLLTSVDGLYENFTNGAASSTNQEPELIEEITHLNEALSKAAAPVDALSRGGMASKLSAASYALEHGVKEVVIAHGRHPERVLEFLPERSTRAVGTRFVRGWSESVNQ